MKPFLAGSIALFFLAHAAAAAPQADGRTVPDFPSGAGQHELSPEWRKLGTTHEARVFMHSAARKEEKGRFAVWIHNDLQQADYLGKEKTYLSLRKRVLVDCKSFRLGISDLVYYADHSARGALVGTERIADAEMLDVVPDSIEDLLVKTVCAPKPRKPAAKKTTAAKAAVTESAAPKDAPPKGTAQDPKAKPQAPGTTLSVK